jgi:hypothetical protein
LKEGGRDSLLKQKGREWGVMDLASTCAILSLPNKKGKKEKIKLTSLHHYKEKGFSK